MAAAVTAALVGSRLGVAGTVIGAGLASVISVVGGAVIGHSILLTRKQVKRAVLQVATGAAPRAPDCRAPRCRHAPPADDRTVVIPAVTSTGIPAVTRSIWTAPAGTPAPGPNAPNPAGRGRPARKAERRGAVRGDRSGARSSSSRSVAVTLVETIKGSPLSGGDSGGLSVLGGNGGTDSIPRSRCPRRPLLSSPRVSTVTQTVTSDAVSAPATIGTGRADLGRADRPARRRRPARSSAAPTRRHHASIVRARRSGRRRRRRHAVAMAAVGADVGGTSGSSRLSSDRRCDTRR